MSTEPSREEHVAWCKRRALSALADGRPGDALAGMLNDLQVLSETKGAATGPIGATLFIAGFKCLKDPDEMRRWIEGFV